jgi:hypothetical protein
MSWAYLEICRSLGNTVSNKQLNLLRTIFQDPLSNNIHWREVCTTLEPLLSHLMALAFALC